MKNKKIFISNSTYNTIKYAKGKGEWYEENSPELVLNYSTGSYIHIKAKELATLSEGIVSFKDKKIKTGYFEPSPLYATRIFIKESEIENVKGFITIKNYKDNIVFLPVINSDVAELIGSNYIFGKFFNDYASTDLIKENLSNSEFIFLFKTEIEFINTYGYPYSLADHNKQLIKKIIESVQTSLTDKVTENQKKVYNLIAPYSFGLELETTSGILPDKYIWETGFLPLRDGSIAGHEYVSVPFVNEIGIKAIQQMGNVAIKNCEIDKFCSLHVHIGNFNLTKKEIIAFYRLCYRVQQEIFDFVPPYKRDETYFASKKQANGQAKDHCKPLRGLYLSSAGTEEEKYNKILDFVNPIGQDVGGNKWNNKSRYFWVNMLPFMSNGKTIEFRLHEPTLNYQKIVLWLLICSALIKYSKKNTDKILKEDSKIMFTDIFSVFEESDYGKKVSNFLIDYINYRTNSFMQLFVNGNYADDSFLRNDKQFKYEENAFRELFL